MGINGQLDLTPAHKKIVIKLLQEHIPQTLVWAYGSRVQGKAHPSSDLDLVVFTQPEQRESIFELKDAFEESDLPFRVDLFVWNEIPEHFHSNIKETHIILQGQ